MSEYDKKTFLSCNSMRKSTGIILTANRSHKSCFICKNSKHLHVIKPSTILQTYIDHKILIKSSTRCCNHHLDENGNIKKEDLNLLKTKM